MHRGVLVLKFALICLLVRVGASASDPSDQQEHLSTHNDHVNDPVKDIDEGIKDIEKDVKDTEENVADIDTAGHEAKELDGAPDTLPLAPVDNHLTDEDRVQGEATSAAVPESPIVSGSNQTDAEKSDHQEETLVAEEPLDKVPDLAEKTQTELATDTEKVWDVDETLLKSVQEPQDTSTAAVPEEPSASANHPPDTNTGSASETVPEQHQDLGSEVEKDIPVSVDLHLTDPDARNVSETGSDQHHDLSEDKNDSTVSIGNNQTDPDARNASETGSDQHRDLEYEPDNPASIVESEGMFTVKVQPPVAMEQTMEEPAYSGDGPQEPQNLTALWDYPAASGDDQVESQVSSGEAELSPSPVREPKISPRILFKVEGPQFPSEEDQEGVHAEDLDLPCEAVPCGAHRLQVTASSAGASVIPAGSTLTVRCSVQGPANATAVVKWLFPGRGFTGANETLDAEEERVTIREEVQEVGGVDERITISTMKVVNTTAADTGAYVCSAVLVNLCCQRNHTLGVRVYVPPSYAVDFAIVGAVCFVEFLVILYFKTRSDRQGRPKAAAAGRGDNGYKADYQPVPLADKPKEVQIEVEEQQRLT